MPTVDERMAKLMASATDETLIEALRGIAATPDRQVTPDLRQAHAWLIEELERRHPRAADAVEVAFDAAAERESRTGEEVDVDYVDVLTTFIERTKGSK